MINIK
jgi:lipase ATG15